MQESTEPKLSVGNVQRRDALLLDVHGQTSPFGSRSIPTDHEPVEPCRRSHQSDVEERHNLVDDRCSRCGAEERHDAPRDRAPSVAVGIVRSRFSRGRRRTL